MSSDIDLEEVQGLVVRGFGNLKEARFFLLGIDDRDRARRWLSKLADAVTSAAMRPDRLAINVAFTATGLRALGLAPDAIAGFSFEFRDGMVSEHRTRILGDVGDSSPEKWQWGGPTQRPVDLLVMLYAADHEALEEARSILDLDESGVSTIKELGTSHLTDREHFGFHDGISQPAIEGSGRGGSPENTIKAGEFLLGYENEYGRYADRPSVERERSRGGPPRSAGCEQSLRPREERDLPRLQTTLAGCPGLLGVHGRAIGGHRRRARSGGLGGQDGGSVADRGPTRRRPR